MLKEEFKPVEGFASKYLVSNYGYVLNQKNSNRVKMSTFEDGRQVLKLNFNGYAKSFSMAKLVISLFSPHDGTTNNIRHLDGNKENNRLDNLQKYRSNNAVQLGITTDQTSKYIGVRYDNISSSWAFCFYSSGDFFTKNGIIDEITAFNLRTRITNITNQLGIILQSKPKKERSVLVRNIIKSQLADYQFEDNDNIKPVYSARWKNSHFAKYSDSVS